MSPPPISTAVTLPVAPPHRRTPAPDNAALAIAIISGLAGALNEPATGFLIHVAAPIAFSVCLARYCLSLLRDAELLTFAARDIEDIRRRVRSASRTTYVLLYGVIAAKGAQLLLSPRSGLITSEAMHSLRPYLAGGLFCLVLVRCCALRIRSQTR